MYSVPQIQWESDNYPYNVHALIAPRGISLLAADIVASRVHH